MIDIKVNPDSLLEITNQLAGKTNFLDGDDHYLFEAYKNIYYFIWLKTGDSRRLFQICSLYTKRYKRAHPDIINYALLAMKSDGHPDSAVYYGKSVVNCLEKDDAFERIKEARIVLSGKSDSENILNIFEGALHWRDRKMRDYVNCIKRFLDGKRVEFNPYISIPVSTVWIEDAPPENPDDSSKLFGKLLNTRTGSGSPEYIISVSCDSKYFLLYGEIFINSLRQIEDNFYCHISITDAISFNVDDDRFSIVNQGISVNCNVGPISSALRYIHAFELLESNDAPVVVMDIDTGFKRGIKPLLERCDEHDVGLRMLKNVLPWEEITAGFGVFNKTRKSRDFLSLARAYLLRTLKLESQQWWVDQNALECASRFMRDDISIFSLINLLPEYVVIPTGSHESKALQLSRGLNTSANGVS